MNSPLIPRIHRLFFTGTLFLLAPAALAAPITDKFNDSSKWGKALKFDSKSGGMSVTDGRMNYISSTTGIAGAAIPRKAPLLPTTKDWSIQVDAHIHPFKLTREGHFVDVFLGIGKTGAWEKTNTTFEFCRGRWGSDTDDYDNLVRSGKHYKLTADIRMTYSDGVMKGTVVATK